MKCEAITLLATWEEFSPLDGMKDFITLSKLLAIGPADHAVAGFVLPEHFLHGICDLPHGAPEAQTKIIPVSSRLKWKQDTDTTGTGPTICLAAGQIYLHWFSFQCCNSEHLTHPTDKTCKGILKKIPYWSCENRFTSGKAMGNGKMKIKLDFLNGAFFGWAQTERFCIWTHAKIQSINQEGQKKGRTHRKEWNLTF